MQKGKEDLIRIPSTRRQPTALLPEITTAVESALKVDGSMIYHAMQERINIAATVLYKILLEYLRVKKVLTCWVPIY